ncbi:hypothetical protein SAMN05421766_10779 [Zobellia uliginosa]|uniref:Uncharacterized protein n=1 Tax=Zobellia uliginosa TaxID=143224 RepID=A0ABY1L0L2_9FLAO|nr:hypothetical protein SAMN05421766_10779 [Zobellia uliginosa]
MLEKNIPYISNKTISGTVSFLYFAIRIEKWTVDRTKISRLCFRIVNLPREGVLAIASYGTKKTPYITAFFYKM